MVNFLTSHTLNSIITCKMVQNLLEAVLSRVASVTQSLICVQLFETPSTAAHQAPVSMEFPRAECWSWLQFPTPEDLPYPGMEPISLVSPALAGRFFTNRAAWEAPLWLSSHQMLCCA